MCLLFDRHGDWTGFLTKYSEFDVHCPLAILYSQHWREMTPAIRIFWQWKWTQNYRSDSVMNTEERLGSPAIKTSHPHKALFEEWVTIGLSLLPSLLPLPLPLPWPLGLSLIVAGGGEITHTYTLLQCCFIYIYKHCTLDSLELTHVHYSITAVFITWEQCWQCN